MEGAALDVAGKIAQGGVSGPSRLELNVPVLGGTEDGSLSVGELVVDVGVFPLKGAAQSAAKAMGERTVVNEEFVIRWLNQLAGLGVQGDRGHDEMNMGMMLKLASPGVQNTDEPSPRPVKFRREEILQGTRALAQQQVVEKGGMSKTEGTELGRKGKGNQEIRNR